MSRKSCECSLKYLLSYEKIKIYGYKKYYNKLFGRDLGYSLPSPIYPRLFSIRRLVNLTARATGLAY
jgi:hypothetical protein